MTRKLTAFALVSTLALTACATGPVRGLDATPIQAGGFVAATGTTVSAETPPADWARLFDAPVLNGLIDQALAANRDIAVAAANLRQVRAVLSETRTARLPSTGVSAGASRVRQANPATGVYDDADAISLGFDLSYELDFFGRVRSGVAAARADAEAAEALLETVRITVAAETARAYADACAAGAQLGVAQRTLDLQQQTYDLVRRQLDAGRGTGLDTARASTALETTRSAIPTLEAQRDSALFRLSVLTGQPPAAAPAAARTCVVVPQVRSIIPVGDGASLLARRPDVRAADRRLAAATARIGVATASLYPSVRLGGAISTASDSVSGLGDDFGFSVGPLISWSFPNIAAARARIAQAGAGADAALATFEQTNLVALQETETALTRYARELDRRSALRRARDESLRARNIARLRFDNGIDNFLTVIDADRTLAGLEAQLAQSDAAVTNNQIDLFRALGGNWR